MRFIHQVRDICCFKQSPQSLETSPLQMAGLFFLSWWVDVIHLWLYLSEVAASLYSLIILVTYSLILWGLLVFTGYGARFRQTITAVWAVDVLVGALAATLAWLEMVLRSEFGLGLTLLWFALLLWSLAIHGHIFRHAFNIRWWLALPLACALVLLNNSLLNILIRHGNL